MDGEDFQNRIARPPESPTARVVHIDRVPRKARFVMVPIDWVDRLEGASGRTCSLALELLCLAWRRRSSNLPVTNKAAKFAGVSRTSKWRALRDLERRGLVEIREVRLGKTPVVRLCLPPGYLSHPARI